MFDDYVANVNLTAQGKIIDKVNSETHFGNLCGDCFCIKRRTISNTMYDMYMKLNVLMQ